MGRISRVVRKKPSEPLGSAPSIRDEFERRVAASFPASFRPKVKLVDKLSSDASAGPDYIKLLSSAHFTETDLRMLEVHEGWVHLGTAFNGKSQPICSFLAAAVPQSNSMQEGLAVLCELLADVSHRERISVLWSRLIAVNMASKGANFQEVYRFFLELFHNQRQSFRYATRIFRGCSAECGPFPKDAGYAIGLVRIIRSESKFRDEVGVRKGMCGKTAASEFDEIGEGMENGEILQPRFLPPCLLKPRAIARLREQIDSIPDSAGLDQSGFREKPLNALESPKFKSLDYPQVTPKAA